MKKNIALKTAFVILGSVIGAGFASGRDIVTFFLEYGVFSSFLIIIMGLLIFYMVYIFIRVGKYLKPKTVGDLTKPIFKKYAKIMNGIAVASLFIAVFAMLAGIDALASDLFVDYNFPYFSILLSFLTIVIVMGGLKSLLEVNSYIVPVMIVFVLLVPILTFLFIPLNPITYDQPYSFLFVGQGVFSVVLYVCLNMFTISIIVTQIGPMITNKLATKTALYSSVFITFCVSLVLSAILNSEEVIINSSMPMVLIAYQLGSFLGGIYSLIVLLGVFTTLISSSFAIDNWFNQFFKQKGVSISIIVFLGFLVSRLGFSNIVSVFYPIEGLFGLIFIVGVILFYYKNRKEIDKLE